MERYTSFKDFYPYYLSEHDNKYTKLLHFIGTTIAIYLYIRFFLTFNFMFLLYSLLVGYGFAWTGHFFVEKNKNASILVKEAAILFETGAFKGCDFVILLCAPIEKRISRVTQRDGVKRAEVLARISKQWEDNKKRPLADFVIENVSLEEAIQQLEAIYRKLSV